MSSRSNIYTSPLLTSGFGDTTGLPPQLDLSDAEEPNEPTADLDQYQDRYQLFINEANAFSHIVHIALQLKHLRDGVHVNVVRHEEGTHRENEACPECNISVTKMTIKDFAVIMNRLFSGKTFPVPLLYDSVTHKVVSTETDVIIQFFNALSEEESPVYPVMDLCPVDSKTQKRLVKVEKQKLNPINLAVGKAAKATTKEEFESAAGELHTALTGLESTLTKRRFLCGDNITEADIIEFVVLFRFDPLLSWVFPLNGKRITLQKRYPAIFGWLRDIYQQPGVEDTCDLVEIANGKGFCASFGVRINELEIEFEPDWEASYLEALGEAHERESMQSPTKKRRVK